LRYTSKMIFACSRICSSASFRVSAFVVILSSFPCPWDDYTPRSLPVLYLCAPHPWRYSLPGFLPFIQCPKGSGERGLIMKHLPEILACSRCTASVSAAHVSHSHQSFQCITPIPSAFSSYLLFIFKKITHRDS